MVNTWDGIDDIHRKPQSYDWTVARRKAKLWLLELLYIDGLCLRVAIGRGREQWRFRSRRANVDLDL